MYIICFYDSSFATISGIYEEMLLVVILEDKESIYISVNISSEHRKTHTFYCHNNIIC